MKQEVIILSQDVEKLKKRAKKIKQEQSIPHHQALEIVAKDAGFKNWHQITKANEAVKPSEDAYYNGCVIAMDMKQGVGFDTSDGVFVEDEYIIFCAHGFLYKQFINCVDECDEHDRKLSETHSSEELKEWFEDEMMNHMFFRLTKPGVDSVKEVLSLVNKRSFWPPMFIWIKGEFIDTYDLPAVDSDDNVVGLRW